MDGMEGSGALTADDVPDSADAIAIPREPAKRLEPAGPRRKLLSWSLALDIWLLAELLALGAAIAVLARDPGYVGQPGLRAPLTDGLTWIAIFAAISWHHRSVHSERPRDHGTVARLAMWCRASAVAGLFLWLTKEGWAEWFWFGTAAGAGLITVALTGGLARIAIRSLSASGALGERIAIYGCGEGTRHLIAEIEAGRGPAARVEALFDERERDIDEIDGHAVSHSIDELIAHAKAGRIDAVMLDLPWSARHRIDELVHRLEQVNVDILMAPTRMDLHRPGRSLGFVRATPTLSLYRRPVTGLEAIGKTVLDRTAALVALVLLAPALLIVALLIKLDSPGPVLFRQNRRGMNNDAFDMLKFRSMYVHAEDQKAEKLVTPGDSRVTRIGAIIRRTSIDELPQLINVLRGEMSLVGPRPHVCEAKAADRLYEEVVRRYPARHRVLPGITGLAQVRGFRGNGWDEQEIINRVESDLEYIVRWSLRLDIQILVRTILILFFQRNVY